MNESIFYFKPSRQIIRVDTQKDCKSFDFNYFWQARDVWLRDDGNGGTRWQTNRVLNPCGYTSWYGNESSILARSDIRMWVK